MNTTHQEAITASNIVPLAVVKKSNQRKEGLRDRFRIIEYINPETKTKSWRVTGWKRDGTRVRKNFTVEAEARVEKTDLELEYRASTPLPPTIQATGLTREQIAWAESAFARLGPDASHEMPLAIEYWMKHGRDSKPESESPRLDEAVKQFKAWLTTSDFRERTKGNLETRVDVFANGTPNLRLSEITPDTIFGYLEKRKVSKASKDNDRRALSRFFAFCIERPRKWIATNPARKETRERRTSETTPSILSLADCETILRTAEKHRDGRLAPYVALCLFGGLRPFEAARLRNDQINLKDGEIRLDATQTKTGRGRVVQMCDTLKAWLKAHKGKPVYPANWRKDFDLIKAGAGFGNPDRFPKQLAESRKEWKDWPDDVLRHTAISHYFRKSGSYGLTAEQFGNSESIIKRHYQGRVSSQDTEKFYSLFPRQA